MAQPNPFDTQDFNPFDGVQTYDPFAGSPQPNQPKLVVNTQDRTLDEHPFGQIDSSFYSPNQNLQLSSDSEDDPIHIAPASTTTSGGGFSSGSRTVHVSTSEDKPAGDGEEPSKLSLEYYQQFFNVDTSEVGWRCLRSMWPFNPNFIEFVQTNPDLYGPFWVTTTLIFMLAAASNFTTWFRHYFLVENGAAWSYDFFKLTTGGAIIWTYAFASPVLLWLYFRWVELDVSLSQLICIYGYSLFAYVPISILCVVPFWFVQWPLVGLACLLSTSFLVVNMWKPTRAKLGHALILLIIMGGLHVILGGVIQLYYFQFWGDSGVQPQPAPQPGPQPAPQPAPQPGF